MSENVSDHRHCVVCGKAISPEENFCSDECEKKFRSKNKSLSKKKRYMGLFLLGIPILLAIVIILLFILIP